MWVSACNISNKSQIAQRHHTKEFFLVGKCKYIPFGYVPSTMILSQSWTPRTLLLLTSPGTRSSFLVTSKENEIKRKKELQGFKLYTIRSVLLDYKFHPEQMNEGQQEWVFVYETNCHAHLSIKMKQNFFK